MVFSSHLFLFYFLPLALLVYYLSPRRGKHLGLTLVSYLFYGWANPAFIPLMLASTLVDYSCGLVIAGQDPRTIKGARNKKLALLISLITNLSMLGFFKYFNLFVDSYNAIASALGASGATLDTTLRIALPLGISFYTFQSMSYTIDLYRGKVKVMRNFIDFACFVSLFPQLVAGPIIRFSEIAQQLESRSHTYEKFARGFAFLTLGLAKKILLANGAGKIADLAFATEGIPFYTAWYGIVAYAFQIYYDFSGYSDMAIGLGLMLGFVFPKNFDSPYLSQSITEFWRRWHLSLSHWLRDYLYIPLGGSQRGTFRTYANLMTVMLLGGLWHGASWNFMIWGGLHGLLLVLERLQGKKPLYGGLPRPLRTGGTFVLILITWVFFRADNLTHALTYLGSMAGLIPVMAKSALINSVVYNPYYIITLVLAAVITWKGQQTWDWTRSLSGRKIILLIGLFALSLTLLASQDFNPFIYFIF